MLECSFVECEQEAKWVITMISGADNYVSPPDHFVCDRHKPRHESFLRIEGFDSVIHPLWAVDITEEYDAPMQSL